MRRYNSIVLVILVILLIFAYVAYPKIHAQLGLAAGTSAQDLNAASPAQLVAIQGAQQLLLLQPLQSKVYLPIITR
jgi:biopolymer transport protein ExbD